MDDRTITTGKVRLSYAHLFVPAAAPGGDDKYYSVSVIIPKSDKQTLAKINAAVEHAKEAGKSSKWGGKIPSGQTGLKLPLRDGDIDKPEDLAYSGSYFFSAKSNKRPAIVDSSRNEIIDPEEVYSGCYGRVNVTFYPYNFNGSKGVGVWLNAVQKTADGDALGGAGVSVEEAFGDGSGMFD